LNDGKEGELERFKFALSFEEKELLEVKEVELKVDKVLENP
jgi:hypothetical protein